MSEHRKRLEEALREWNLHGTYEQQACSVDSQIGYSAVCEALDGALGALRKAVYELNTIRARDGVPWTGVPFPMKTDVVESYFSSVVDECFEVLESASAALGEQKEAKQ